MRILNLFSGFAFVFFGYSAILMIPEMRNYIGQTLIFEAYFYVLGFSFTFIIWALTYFDMREEAREIEEELDSLHLWKDLEDEVKSTKSKMTNKKQMELDL